MGDVTYCINPACPFTDCNLHCSHLDKAKGVFTFVFLADKCERYIDYLNEIREKDNG